MAFAYCCPYHGYSCSGQCFPTSNQNYLENLARLQSGQQLVTTGASISVAGTNGSILVSNGSVTNEKIKSKKLLLLLG